RSRRRAPFRLLLSRTRQNPTRLTPLDSRARLGMSFAIAISRPLPSLPAHPEGRQQAQREQKRLGASRPEWSLIRITGDGAMNTHNWAPWTAGTLPSTDASVEAACHGNGRDILLQGFHWDSHAGVCENGKHGRKSWYRILKENAAAIRSAGFTWVWF